MPQLSVENKKMVLLSFNCKQEFSGTAQVLGS